MSDFGLGRHVLVELHGCDRELLDNLEDIQGIMLEAAEHAGASVVAKSFHQFAPQGVSGTVTIAESHLAIHTWPEHGYAAVDVFTCGDVINPWDAQKYIRDALGAETYDVNEIKRGIKYKTGEYKNVD